LRQRTSQYRTSLIATGCQRFGAREEIARDPLVDESHREREHLLEQHGDYQPHEGPERACCTMNHSRRRVIQRHHG
jgi:hypothetical protein